MIQGGRLYHGRGYAGAYDGRPAWGPGDKTGQKGYASYRMVGEMAEKQAESTIARDGRGRFKEGSSGNPAGGGSPGRPANEARQLARKHGTGCFPMLGRIVKSKKVPERDKINAARVLLAYGYGQPKQDVDLTVGGQVTYRHGVEGLSVEELRAIISGGLRGKGEEAGAGA